MMRCLPIHLAFLITWAIAFAACGQESTPTPTQPALQPVPRFEPQSHADVDLRKRYAAEFKDHSAEGELALAKTLREASIHEPDPATQYAELREARDLAVFGGNFSDSFLAIDMMAGTFDINAHDMKQAALALGMDGARTSPAELIDAYLSIANNQLTNKDVDLAGKALQLAQTLAHDARDPALVAHVKEAGAPIVLAKRAQVRFMNAARTLQYHKDDPAANLIVGSYLCGYLEAWSQGLPYLSKSGNAKLAGAAELEMKEPAGASAMADIGDAWWSVADADALDPAVARRRAAYWYAKADPGLAGDRKHTAEDRIAFAKK